MTRRRPTVSLVVDRHGGARALRRSLPGLRHLRDVELEVVVVGGPSMDDTAAAIGAHAGDVKIVACPTGDRSRSRNIAIAAAAGDLIAFIDDDAIPDDVRWLARYVDAFTADESGRLGAAGGPVRHADTPCVEFPSGGDGIERVHASNCAFRRHALVSVGGFDDT